MKSPRTSGANHAESRSLLSAAPNPAWCTDERSRGYLASRITKCRRTIASVARRSTAGRPARVAGEATTLIALRLTSAERELYRAEARDANVSLSDWIRGACETALSARRRRALRTRGSSKEGA